MPNWKFTVTVKLACFYFLTTYEVRIASIFTLFLQLEIAGEIIQFGIPTRTQRNED